MERWFFGAGFFALAAAILIASLGLPAYAQTAGYSKCAVVKTDFLNDVNDIETANLMAVPAGWTPLGGSAVPKGTQYAGVVVLCK